MKKVGLHSLDTFLRPLMKKACEKKVFSGAATAVFFRERGEGKKGFYFFGQTRNDSRGTKVNMHTLFDLASLTKPLCTTLCVLSMIEQQKLAWKQCLKDAINVETGSLLEKTTIEQLLSHSSGLRDYRPFFRDFKAVSPSGAREKILQAILKEQFVYKPGEKCVYSDLGYMLLGEIVERVSGTSLDRYFEKEITRPLQLENQLVFRTLAGPRDRQTANIAATEKCPWRKKILQGEVHDEHCWLFGGVAGHAGLFGTAGAVLRITEKILQQWRGRDNHPAYSSTLLHKALQWRNRNSTWRVGFDRPSAEGSSAGTFFSADSAGHLGFTGTSFWIDPEKEVIVVLLTNRVHPTRKNEKIREFRPLFHNIVMKSLGAGQGG